MNNLWKIAGLPVAALAAFGQDKIPVPRVPVQMIVTVEAKHAGQVPDLKREDFLVFHGKERVRVSDSLPLTGEHAGLELFLLLDDSASSRLGLQLEDLKRFIEAQPATTAIGVGYMRNGTVSTAQNLTSDHALAAKSLRLPMGSPGAMGSPYWSLSDLIKHWPESSQRRIVVMVTDGVDRYGAFGLSSPYVDAAIEDAQRAGIAVYSIYMPAAGHFGHSRWRVNSGQNFLAKTAEETGGEAYYLGFGAPVSFQPYLAEISEHLKHQYRITFWMTPGERNELQPVRVATEIPNADITAPDRVLVPGTK